MTDIENIHNKKISAFESNAVISIEIPPTIKTTVKRRTSIPNRLQDSISLWSIMRNSIGKDLSRIAIPVRTISQSDRKLVRIRTGQGQDCKPVGVRTVSRSVSGS